MTRITGARDVLVMIGAERRLNDRVTFMTENYVTVGGPPIVTGGAFCIGRPTRRGTSVCSAPSICAARADDQRRLEILELPAATAPSGDLPPE